MGLQADPPGGSLQPTVHEAFQVHRAIDLDADFFEAGFTSSQLAYVVSGLVESGLDIRLLDVYAYPTVRALAAELDARRGGRTGVTPPWLDEAR
jgi:hypothetical protein